MPIEYCLNGGPAKRDQRLCTDSSAMPWTSGHITKPLCLQESEKLWPDFRNEQTSRIINVQLAFRSFVVLASLAKRSFWYQHVQRQCGASGIKQHQHAWATTMHRIEEAFP